MFSLTIQYFLFGVILVLISMLVLKIGEFLIRNLIGIRREFEDSRQHFPMAREHYGSVPEWKRRELRTQAEEEFEKLIPQRDILEKRIERMKQKKNPSGAVAGRIRRDEDQLREIEKKLAAMGC